MNLINCVRDSYDLVGYILRGKNKIDAPACYGASGHIRLRGGIEFLRNGDASYVFYAAQRCGSIAVEPRYDDGDDFAVPMFG